MVVFVLSLSLLLQLLAIYFTLSLIRLTGRKLAWAFIASAISLMALRRGISLAGILAAGQTAPHELIVELVALTISALMVVGIARVRPVFKEVRSIADRLGESEERYRAVITGMSEGVVLQGPDGVVLTCNPSAERILGLTSKDIVGRAAADSRWGEIHEDGSVFSKEDNPALVALRTGLPQNDIVMGIKRPDEKLVWISINAQPLFSSGESRPYAVVVTFNDITKRKQDTEKLAKHLEELERFKSATISREFRVKQLHEEVEQLKERLKDQ